MTERAADLDALADALYGRGQWLACSACPDRDGQPTRHHRNLHDRTPAPRPIDGQLSLLDVEAER